MIHFNISLFIVSVLAGGIACISGFGIGSLVTPLLAFKVGTSVAVAGVSIAHFLGTALRFWLWKKYINRKVLLSFGLTSALGGLIGALFHNIFQNIILTDIFGCLLVFAGFMGLTGLSENWRFRGAVAWGAGALSGIFGGLVGNQGGIRSAAMFGFDLKGKEFVATATGIALAVDTARMPVYCFMQWKDIQSIWPLIAVASAGVLIGTEIGVRVMGKIPENLFKRFVSGVILLIGVFILLHR
ncbi:MAG: sulfite exporter TauE/SafE family protein [Candidatus Omnitrophica bacterium]|nr:sulfite exporter TauE/SafE family protein [Candidatus Omnitrophota bacterium]